MYGEIGVLTAIFGIISIVALCFGIAGYLFMALGLSKITERLKQETGEEIPYSWLAWVPVAQYYVLGAVLEYVEGDKKKVPYAVVFTVIAAAGFVLGYANSGLLTDVASILQMVMYGYTGYSLAALLTPNKQVLVTVLSVFFLPFVIFGIRNNPFHWEDDSYSDPQR